MIASLSPAARYRWRVASRVLAAVMGGYALTSAVTVLLAIVWPLPPAEAILLATMLSFILYVVILVWIFSVKRLQTIWLGLTLMTVICAGLSWALLPGGV